VTPQRPTPTGNESFLSLQLSLSFAGKAAQQKPRRKLPAVYFNPSERNKSLVLQPCYYDDISIATQSSSERVKE
jgi:hypothetical protein